MEEAEEAALELAPAADPPPAPPGAGLGRGVESRLSIVELSSRSRASAPVTITDRGGRTMAASAMAAEIDEGPGIAIQLSADPTVIGEAAHTASSLACRGRGWIVVAPRALDA